MTDRAAEITELVGRLAELLAASPAPAPAPREPRTLFTPEEAAEQLAIGRTSVYRLIRSGDLASVQIGRLRRVPASAIADYAARLIQQDAA